ncbi:ABC transporter ATP-binding protein [uncultured Allobaculum sp.]|uniref:ABC transporter ATP-binding protein n=1 Tax=uncultured Allobaculum sp. TaxID=1187017 RepID=UPI00258863CB|nr:ABC transporter ATP-binding protein [uncultured Allobaculum sp.]
MNGSAIFKLTRSARKDFILAVIYVAIETLLEVITPVLMADIIDIGVMHRDTSIFVSRGLGMLACAAGSLLFGLLYAKAAARAAATVASQIRQAQFDQIEKFSFENIDRFESSGLITRLTSDVMVLQNTITNGIRPIARGPLMLILGIIMCFIISWKLSIVYLIVSPIMALLLIWIVSKVAPQYRFIQKTVDALNEAVEENLIAIRLVKSFVRADYETDRFDRVNEDLASLMQKTNHLAFLNLPLFQASMYITILVLLAIGSMMIVQSMLAVGQLTGIMSYVLQIMNAFIMMSNIFLLLTRSAASIHRIEEVLDEKITMHSPEQGKLLQDGSIDFENVSFKYSKEGREDVLSDVTLHIPSGSRVGIIGATGSAKSSLAMLIPRLYDVSSGTLKVGQENVHDLDLKALREDVAMVLQKNTLFSGTVRDNLKWGNPNASDDEILKAIDQAGASELIARLPGGLDMELGQAGVNVSGGQKQRLCIGRALLKKPKILIFDDSTSAVDTKTDALIRKNLAEIHGLTQIIIAQRVSSISHCDQIVVMDQGRIVQTGTHDELLKTSPIYREIYESQQGGGQPDEQ